MSSSTSTALVDGNNSLGAVVGNFAMNLAITKAKETGVAWVTVRYSYQELDISDKFDFLEVQTTLV